MWFSLTFFLSLTRTTHDIPMFTDINMHCRVFHFFWALLWKIHCAINPITLQKKVHKNHNKKGNKKVNKNSVIPPYACVAILLSQLLNLLAFPTRAFLFIVRGVNRIQGKVRLGPPQQTPAHIHLIINTKSKHQHHRNNNTRQPLPHMYTHRVQALSAGSSVEYGSYPTQVHTIRVSAAVIPTRCRMITC